MDGNWDIRIELSDSRSSDFGTRFADILFLEEELGGEIGDGNGCGVIEGEGLDSGKGDVLGCERLGKRKQNARKCEYSPISTPRPLRPTTRTLEEPMRFMASWPST